MGSWAVVFLGVIAVSSLVQAGFLIGLALSGRRLARRFDELQDRFDREIRPALDQLSRVSRNLGEITDLAVLQVRRVDGLVEDTILKIDEAMNTLRRLLLGPVGPVANAIAVLRGVRRGIQVFRQLRGLDAHARQPRRYADDEHLFI